MKVLKEHFSKRQKKLFDDLQSQGYEIINRLIAINNKKEIESSVVLYNNIISDTYLLNKIDLLKTVTYKNITFKLKIPDPNLLLFNKDTLYLLIQILPKKNNSDVGGSYSLDKDTNDVVILMHLNQNNFSSIKSIFNHELTHVINNDVNLNNSKSDEYNVDEFLKGFVEDNIDNVLKYYSHPTELRAASHEYIINFINDVKNIKKFIPKQFASYIVSTAHFDKEGRIEMGTAQFISMIYLSGVDYFVQKFKNSVTPEQITKIVSITQEFFSWSKQWFNLHKQEMINESARLSKYAWQMQSGKLKPIKSSHTDDAIDILKLIGITHSGHPIEELMKKGWQRITCSNNTIYANNVYKTPNPKQRKELIDLALLDGNISEIYWDNDTNDVLIWKKGE